MTQIGLGDAPLPGLGSQALRALGTRLAGLFLITAALGVLLAPRHGRPVLADATAGFVALFAGLAIVIVRRAASVLSGVLLAAATVISLVLATMSSSAAWPATHQVTGWIAAGVAGGVAASWGAGWGLGYFGLTVGIGLVAESVAGGPAPAFTFLGSFTYYVGAALVHMLARRGFALTEAELVTARRAEAARAIAHERWQARRRLDRQLHDTVLVALSVLAQGGSGVSAQQVREACTDSVNLLHELEHRAPEAPSPPGPPVTKDAKPWPGLDAVISRARTAGLTVDVHVGSQPTSGLGLTPSVQAALEAAVAQCLDNVSRHAGTSQVAVTMSATEAEVVVVVVDQGRGFDPAQVPTERLGLRASVIERLGEVGGHVTLWSAPERGTSIMLRVPARSAGRAEISEGGQS